jgi:methionyl-tRNA formyltransferase
MKMLLVTSQVTFVPENYNLFLESFFENLADDRSDLDALIVLENNSPLLILKGLYLWLIGARKIGSCLITNSIMALNRDHQKIAKTFGITTLYFKNPNDPKFIEYVKEKKIDLIINARTRYIYRKKILNAPTLGCINIHHGILPNYRGTMCDLYALSENRPAGFSIHKMESKVDTGAIIRVKELSFKDSTLNFSHHIKESSRLEGFELSNIVKTIKNSGRIPIDCPNTTATPVYTKNPNFKQIRKMINKGIIL